jgi:hypothetical protein
MATRILNPHPNVAPSTLKPSELQRLLGYQQRGAEGWWAGSAGSGVSYEAWHKFRGTLRGWDAGTSGISTHEVLTRARPDKLIVGASLMACVSAEPLSVNIFPRDSVQGEIVVREP